jgi:hypothetical protein
MALIKQKMPAQLQRLTSIAAVLQLRLGTTYDRSKTLLFLYVFVRYALKSYRHLRARGTINTVKEGWKWLSAVSTTTNLHLTYAVLMFVIENAVDSSHVASNGRQG